MATFKSSGTDKDVKLQPTGTGKVLVGTGAAAATVASDGDNDLVLQTGNATTGSITVTDGANGDISLTPNGTGSVVVSTQVGVGTNSPSKKIELYGNSGTSIDQTTFRLTCSDASASNNQPISRIETYTSDADGPHIASYIETIATKLYGVQNSLSFGVSQTDSTDATEVMRIDNDGNVRANKFADLAGTGAPDFPNGHTVGDGAESTPSIANTGNTNTGIYFPAADTVGVSTNGSERLRIDSSGNVELKSTNAKLILPSGGGIDFSAYGAGTNIDSNLLNDYEEGTWTPKITEGTGGTDTVTSVNSATYTKIGRLVTLFFNVTCSSASGSAGYLEGLPFDGVASSGNVGIMVERGSGGTSYTFEMLFANSFLIVTNTTSSTIGASSLSGTQRGSLTYYTA